MFSSENLEKHCSNLLIKRFINTFAGSGKTTCVIEQAKKCLEKGEKVIIVTPHTYIGRELLKDVLYDVGYKHEQDIECIHMDKVLKELRHYKDEATECDPTFVTYKKLKCFDGYNRVLIEPACYEYIIRFLLDKLSDLNKVMKKSLKDF